MNEKSTIKELIAQLRSSEHWVKEIVAAYLGVEPGEVVIGALCKTQNFGGEFSTSSKSKNP